MPKDVEIHPNQEVITPLIPRHCKALNNLFKALDQDELLFWSFIEQRAKVWDFGQLTDFLEKMKSLEKK